MSSTTQLQEDQETTITIHLETILIDLNKKADSKADFDSLLLEAVDSAFSMLGDSNKQALYFHLKNSFGVSKEAIPQNVEVFVNALEHVFGQSALLLQVQIMKALRSKVPHFRFSPKQGNLSFIGYLESIRSSCNYI